MGGKCCSGSDAPHQPGRTPARSSNGGSQEDSLFEKSAVQAHTIQHERVIPTIKGAIRQSYRLGQGELGAGSYGTVCRAVHSSGEPRAVKTVKHKGLTSLSGLHSEIATMQAMDHPNVIKLFEAYEDEKCTCLVMEICEGGELLDRLVAEGCFSESQSALVTQQILRAVRYVHGKDIVHRDLKPQNFLLANKGGLENNTVKLIDFGFARTCKPGTTLKTVAGTALYVAPEVLRGKYDKQCDLWSVGVTLYALLSGRAPFTGRTEQDIMRKVKTGVYSLEGVLWQRVSKGAKDLIRSLMQVLTAKRLTAEQALEHAWITENLPASRKATLDRDVVERLQGFRVQNKLDRAVLQIVARHLSEDKVKDLRDAFEFLDANGDGKLTPQELWCGLNDAGFECDRLDFPSMMAMADADGSGEIDYSEFLAATLDQSRHLTEGALLVAFHIFDRDGDGSISEQELKQVLSSDTDSCRDGVVRLLSDLDANGNGIVDFEEFKGGVLQGRCVKGCVDGAAPSSKKAEAALPAVAVLLPARRGGA